MALRLHSATSRGEHLLILGATNASATRPYLHRSLEITGMRFAQAMTMSIVMDRDNLTPATERRRIPPFALAFVKEPKFYFLLGSSAGLT